MEEAVEGKTDSQKAPAVWEWAGPIISTLGRQRQVEVCKFETSLVYRVHSRASGTMHRETLS